MAPSISNPHAIGLNSSKLQCPMWRHSHVAACAAQRRAAQRCSHLQDGGQCSVHLRREAKSDGSQQTRHAESWWGRDGTRRGGNREREKEEREEKDGEGEEGGRDGVTEGESNGGRKNVWKGKAKGHRYAKGDFTAGDKGKQKELPSTWRRVNRRLPHLIAAASL